MDTSRRRRLDYNLDKILNYRLCEDHFEACAFMCPSDKRLFFCQGFINTLTDAVASVIDSKPPLTACYVSAKISLQKCQVPRMHRARAYQPPALVQNCQNKLVRGLRKIANHWSSNSSNRIGLAISWVEDPPLPSPTGF